MLKRVRERELGIGRAEFRRRNARARFSSYRLEQQHDTHDPDAANLKLSFLRRRSKIVEIVAAGDVVFALDHVLSEALAKYRADVDALRAAAEA